jgi:hypothetical protein
MQFCVEPVELTVQTVVSKDANGKIGWHLLGRPTERSFVARHPRSLVRPTSRRG